LEFKCNQRVINRDGTKWYVCAKGTWWILFNHPFSARDACPDSMEDDDFAYLMHNLVTNEYVPYGAETIDQYFASDPS
jgi:hypothetical protein